MDLKLLAKVLGMNMKEEMIRRDNHSLKAKLIKFDRGGLEMQREK